MDLDKLIAQFGKDLEWFFFYSKYCTGKNIANAFCRDFKWWALGTLAVLTMLVVWWIGNRVARAYRNWSFERARARIADEETMKRHAWSGYTPDAATSADQRAGKERSPRDASESKRD